MVLDRVILFAMIFLHQDFFGSDLFESSPVPLRFSIIDRHVDSIKEAHNAGKKEFAFKYIVCSKKKEYCQLFDEYLQWRNETGSFLTLNDEGQSLLAVAIKCESLYAIQKLIQAGSDISHCDREGLDLLSQAINTGNIEIVNYLLSVINDSSLDDSEVRNEKKVGRIVRALTLGVTELFDAVTSFFVPEYLLFENLPDGSLADTAIIFDNLHAFTFFHKSGLLLHDQMMLLAARHGAVQVIQYLADQGVDPNVQDAATGNTPLMIAIQEAHKPKGIFLVLLQKLKAHSNAQNNVGDTPLHCVLKRYLERLKPQNYWLPESGQSFESCPAQFMTYFLMKAGADFMIKNSYDRSPIDYALSHQLNDFVTLMNNDAL